MVECRVRDLSGYDAAMGASIARVWKGSGSPGGVKRYCDEHFCRIVLPQLRRLNGFLGATLLVHDRESESELVVITQWVSISAIRQFAGDVYERAVVEPAVCDLLDHFEDRVTHYTIALTAEANGGAA